MRQLVWSMKKLRRKSSGYKERQEQAQAKRADSKRKRDEQGASVKTER